MRAISLLSGGLDSLLATKVILEQGIEIEAMSFVSPFCTCTPKTSSCSAARSAVRQLGIDLKAVSTTSEFLEVVKNPKHGYGKNLNPCIDCRILIFRKAGDYMRESGASFIITGEVLGERPMSQRRPAMMLIEREAGLEGLIVRPLSAALLKPSLPEKEGWIDREKLLDIQGRSRKPQIQLAAHYGLTDYPCPAGGCLLTDPAFAVRMRDLMQFNPDFSLNDVNLLKVGRHFRLGPATKVVVGRHEEENERISSLSTEGDTLLELKDFPGPLTLVRGPVSEDDLTLAASITARYSKARNLDRVGVTVSDKDGTQTRELQVPHSDEESLTELLIGG